MTPRSQILHDVPYPIAYPYSLVFAEHERLDAAWRASSGDLEIGRDLAQALLNVGAFLQRTGRQAEAEGAFRRCLAMLEGLTAAAPADVDLKAMHAGCLLGAGRLAEASRLASEVLQLEPEHEYARDLTRRIDARRRTTTGGFWKKLWRQ